MYREEPRTNGMTEASVYGIDTAQQVLKTTSAFLPQVRTEPLLGNEPEALLAAISFGALLVIILASLLQAWL